MLLIQLKIGSLALNNMIKKNIILRIKIQGSPIIWKIQFEYWTPYPRFRLLKFYVGTRYECAHRLSKKYPCVLHTKPHLIKNKHELITLYLQLTITDILLYALFFDPRFATYLHFQKPNPHDSFRLFLSTSVLFVSNTTLTKTGEDSICNISSRKSQKRFLEIFTAQSFLLFLYIHYFELQIINHRCDTNRF